MKVSALKTDSRTEVKPLRGLDVQSYGERNDYPQRVDEIVAASITGSSCLRVYASFIAGRGFADQLLWQTVLNRRGDTADDVLGAVSQDLARFGGFALHVNWNAAYKITEVTHVPFEFTRLGLDDSKEHSGMIAIHPDWGRRRTALKRFDTKDIDWLHPFNPDKVREEVTKAGGWKNYKGQVLWYSNAGRKCYPVPIFDAALTDMSAEEGLGNVALRNVRNNYLPAGMFIDHNNALESKEQEEEMIHELKEFQGDTNSGKILYFNLKDGEQVPEFKPFDTRNVDKDFEQTDSNVPEKIGRAFNQPPILRAKDVGANFGADLMRNAYDFYNSVTETERFAVERVFRQVLSLFAVRVMEQEDYSIQAKEYRVNETLAERLGDNTDKVLEVLFDGGKSESAKRAVLKVVYGLADWDIDTLITSL